MDKFNYSEVVVDGVLFFSDKTTAIQAAMGYPLRGVVWTNIIEVEKDGVYKHFYSVKISEERPQKIKTSTGMDGTWVEIRTPKKFGSYFNTSDAVTAQLKDLS